MDDLPDYFDVIVIGTGMPECIIAAAAARVGKTVLHLERNGYYGGDWASFSFDKFLEWIEDTKNNIESSQNEPNPDETLTSFLRENERLAYCRIKSNTISNLVVKPYINDIPSEPVIPVPVPVPEPSLPPTHSEESPLLESSTNEIHEAESTQSEPTPSAEAVPLQNEWTISQFIENRRKFNIDLTPKIMFSRGSLVELLISSNIARYAEFQCVNRVLTYVNDRIEQVPCSRADVFSTKNVTVVEKRMLMKFLTFCLKFEEHEDEYKGFEEAPFLQFLRSKKLTPNVEHYIMHAIAMVNETCNTLEGLKATQKFLQSLGRYGKSPFLCTYYGSAELPQCFCRLCSVFGGLYYLKRDVEAVVMDTQCQGIVSRNQRINCRWLVIESSYCPTEFMPAVPLERISRGIFITNRSLYPASKNENILLKLPPSPSNSTTVTVLEFSSKTFVCPEDLYIVYMYCRSSKSTAEDDLQPIADLLFESAGAVSEVQMEGVVSKPSVLWCLFFNQLDTSTVDLNFSSPLIPQGVYITSSPDSDLDYENAVKQAQDIFAKMCPDEEFLPRAPDPEDIIIENHNNDGDNDHENAKIENDVVAKDEGDSGDNLRENSVAETNTENAVASGEGSVQSEINEESG